ncbi:hypothetical protein D3C80_2082810 [compost metagenome]
MGGCLQHAEAGKPHEGKHVEGTRAWAENAIIETHERCGGEAEHERRDAAMAVDIAELRLEGEIQGNRDQQRGHDGAQEV